MKVKEPESIEDKLYRTSVIDRERQKDIPIIVAFIVLAIIGLALYKWWSVADQVEQYGAGAPYICESCRNSGRACSEHRNYDKDAALDAKVLQFVTRYSADDSDEQLMYNLYGFGNTYNTECDFCCKDKTECYACKHDRLVIADVLNTVTSTEQFKANLCHDCFILGYAHCDRCYDMLATMICENIRGND